MPRPPEFKRMIVGLPHAPGDYSLVVATAKLAGLMRLDLVAMFADDRSLLHAAGLPCVRELRSLGGGWQDIDARQFGAELKHSAETARRRFAEIADNCNIATSFRVEQGSAAEIVGSLATADDIVVIIEPRNPAERVTQQFTGLMESAFRAAASVMLVPSRVARNSGPIVAVAAVAEDPSIETAIGIAGAAREKPLVLGPEHLAASLSKAADRLAGTGVEFGGLALGPLDAARLDGELRRRAERLIVISRGTLEDAAARTLASLRAVPIMILEPARANA